MTWHKDLFISLSRKDFFRIKIYPDASSRLRINSFNRRNGNLVFKKLEEMESLNQITFTIVMKLAAHHSTLKWMDGSRQFFLSEGTFCEAFKNFRRKTNSASHR